MLFDETLISLFETDIGLKSIFCLEFLRFCYYKTDILSTSTQILESVYVPGHTFQGKSRVNINAIE